MRWRPSSRDCRQRLCDDAISLHIALVLEEGIGTLHQVLSVDAARFAEPLAVLPEPVLVRAVEALPNSECE